MLADCWLYGGYLDVDVVMNQLRAGGCLHMGYLAFMNECFIINQSTSDI